MCYVCSDEEEMLRLGYPKRCEYCNHPLGLHSDYYRIEWIHDNRVGAGPFTFCRPACLVRYYGKAYAD